MDVATGTKAEYDVLKNDICLLSSRCGLLGPVALAEGWWALQGG